MRKITFSDLGWEHYLWWQKQDRKILKRINSLICECSRTPFEGTGKPEPLKYQLKGWWSRRVTDSDRLVYRCNDDEVEIAYLRGHYD